MNVAILSPSGPNKSASPGATCPSDPVRGADGVQHAPALDQLDAALPLQLDQAAASALDAVAHVAPGVLAQHDSVGRRSEEHTSELQSLMRISYAVFCLKKKTHKSSTERNERQ